MPVPVPVAANAGNAPKNIWVAAGEGDLERVRYLIEVEGRFRASFRRLMANIFDKVFLLRSPINGPTRPYMQQRRTDSWTYCVSY